ncbi:MAG: LLM class flavin-dependent oxidoreductase [Mycetocola sp.]
MSKVELDRQARLLLENGGHLEAPSYELWTQTACDPLTVVAHAQRLERDGWDGITYGDSQNLTGDVYVAMAAASLSTQRIRLATGVTNAATRHPAVTAAASASLGLLSGGRAEVGIGRGDSALAHIGLAPSSLATFDSYVAELQSYLRGDSVPLRQASQRSSGPKVSTLGLAKEPPESRLNWLSGDVAKVPVFVVASGPKVIELAARRADRVALVLGADPERLRWGVDLARSVNPDIAVSAYVDLYIGSAEEALARSGARLATHARFSSMHGAVSAPIDAASASTMREIARNYDMTKHARGGSSQISAITAEFAERFAIIGDVSECVDRLDQLSRLGIDRFHIWTHAVDPSSGAPDSVAEQLIPATRARSSQAAGLESRQE